MWQAADAMVLGRKIYEGLAAVWPQMADLPGLQAREADEQHAHTSRPAR